MDVVILHVLDSEPTPEYGRLWIATPGLSPDERVALWEGLPPGPVPDHPCVAPVVLSGEVDGRRAYAERIPVGVRMSAHPPPAELLTYVAARVLEALEVVHGARQVHGNVVPERVVLGQDGEVVLIGRGRRGGIVGMDLIAASSLLPASTSDETLPGESAQQAAAELSRRSGPDDRARLATWVRDHLPTRAAASSTLALTIGAAADEGADEVVPDLGPDSGHDGILDRWGITATGTGERTATGAGERTPEVGEGQPSVHQRLSATLWARFDAPPGPAVGAPDRFEAVAGLPSRGLRALLADEPPEALPAPLVANLGAFAVREVVADDPLTAAGRMNPQAAADLENTEAVTRTLPAITDVSITRPRVEADGRRRWVELGVAMVVGGLIVWACLQLLAVSR